MMSITHATITTAGVSLILGTADPLALFLSLIGSQLPNIDTSTSTIGKIFFPVSYWIEERYPHRTITHSLLATIGLAASSAVIGFVTKNHLWAALPLGHLLACFSDCFTKQGVQLVYPEGMLDSPMDTERSITGGCFMTIGLENDWNRWQLVRHRTHQTAMAWGTD